MPFLPYNQIHLFPEIIHVAQTVLKNEKVLVGISDSNIYIKHIYVHTAKNLNIYLIRVSAYTYPN